MEPLGWKQLNRAVLARQLLLDRSDLPLHRAVERMAGVQAQYIPSAYVGLWSRVEGFSRDKLTSSLHRGSVVQGTLMRGTIHLVSRADYWPVAAAIRQRMREWWLQVQRSGVTSEDMEELGGRLRRSLADGPRKPNDLIAELGIDRATWGGAGFWVELVRIPPSGTWESRRADLYGLATSWVGPDVADPTRGVDHLVRRYLAAFGPASRDDIKAFTSLSLATIDAALERLAPTRHADEDGGALFDVPGAPLPDRDVPAPVRFLGTWDAILLVHARRSLVLPEEYRSRIFHTKAPHSFNTFLIDGQVAGTWGEEGGQVTVSPFQPIPRRHRRELEEERARLETLHR
ncbi:MAG TPA: winged helix DNA-binding domain-containing protein [Acidimicrobiia bacterium]|nr:winged helix DNA-binding domain-containing protein [Acidimicrobiia bacterium]